MSNKPDFKSRGQWFVSVEDLYVKRLNSLVAFARKHVYQNDSAIDIVHDAIVKSIEYFKKYPDKKVYERIVQYQILKLAKKHNRYSSIQKTSGLMGINGDDDGE